MTSLIEDIRACSHCAPYLALGPRPIVQFSATSRIVIIGQAPGARVHQSGIPWNDASGERLRDWTGLIPEIFYDPSLIALVPMGFCYPGTGASGDLPPRPECAPLWHEKVMALLPSDRLTLLVGGYAQSRYLPATNKRSLTETVRRYEELGPMVVPLPHPSWRSTGWMRKNPWFEAKVIPALQHRISRLLD